VYLGSLVTPNNGCLVKQNNPDCKEILSWKTIAVETSLTSIKINHLQDLAMFCAKKNQLLVFERKVIRMICDTKVENDVYRRRYNFKLEREYNSPSVVNVVERDRLH
jgi:hypothetical protein